MVKFIIGVPTKKTSVHLFSVIQISNDTLGDYMTRFNNEALQIQDIQVDIVVEAMKKGVRHKRFFDSLEKSPLKPWAS